MPHPVSLAGLPNPSYDKTRVEFAMLRRSPNRPLEYSNFIVKLAVIFCAAYAFACVMFR